MSVNINEYIKSIEGLDDNMKPNARVDFVSTLINIQTDEVDGIPVECPTASVDFRDMGGYILLSLNFNNPQSGNMKMVYNYLEKYAKDLDDLDENSIYVPEVVFTMSGHNDDDFFLLFTNPIFWSWNSTGAYPGEFDSIRILFEEKNYGFYKNN